MSITRTTASKNLALDAVYDQCNGGKVKIYGGSVPANAQAALGGATLLAQPSFGATAFAAATGGTKTANAIANDTDAAADGTATFYRSTKSDGTVVSQGTVGLSGADLNLLSVTIKQHTSVGIQSFVMTSGA